MYTKDIFGDFLIKFKYGNKRCLNMDVQEIEQNIESAVNLLKALSNKKRLQIMCALSNNERSVGELEQIVSLSQSALSQHLKELKFAGLIQGETEPPYIKYCLNKENWNKAKAIFGNLLEGS